MLDLWEISKPNLAFMTIYGVVHNVFYLCLAWAQIVSPPDHSFQSTWSLGGYHIFSRYTDFALCVLFVMLSLWCEGLSGQPSCQRYVNQPLTQPSKIFGLLEGGRGGVELLQNTLAVGLYTALGYNVLGLELAFMVNAGIMIILGIIAWLGCQKKRYLNPAPTQKGQSRSLRGMKVTLRLPEVWLAGAVGFAVTWPIPLYLFPDLPRCELHTLPCLSHLGLASSPLQEDE